MKKYGKYEHDLPVIQFVGFVGPTGEIQRGKKFERSLKEVKEVERSGKKWKEVQFSFHVL